jgi:hypothetical protein
MKTTLFSLLVCFAAISGNAMSFTIQGQIDGLMPGDTLTFERLSLPGFEYDFAFNVVVEKQDEFTYTGSHKHIEYYSMTYKPILNKPNYSSRPILTLLIKDGITTLTGTADQIYYCQVQGGLYDNETLQKALQLDNSLGKERGALLELHYEASAEGDSIKATEYLERVNSFGYDRSEDYEKLSLLNNEFYEKYPSSEHTIIHVLRRINSTPFEQSKERYEKMNDEARNSHFGVILKQGIDRIADLQPGNKAPEFHLVAINGEEISLNECAGSYVLIYHWGLCPGSIMMNDEVIEFHNKYKDHLIVIGITERMDYIQSVYDNTPPDGKFMDLDLKPVLANMLAHPWLDAELTNDNGKIEKDYAIAGLPYFVFISPDGKIVARDFHQAFYTAKEKIEAEFGN